MSDKVMNRRPIPRCTESIRYTRVIQQQNLSDKIIHIWV